MRIVLGKPETTLNRALWRSLFGEGRICPVCRAKGAPCAPNYGHADANEQAREWFELNDGTDWQV